MYQGSGSVGIDFRIRAGTRIECKGANLQEDALSLRLVAVQIMRRMAGEKILEFGCFGRRVGDDLRHQAVRQKWWCKL